MRMTPNLKHQSSPTNPCNPHCNSTPLILNTSINSKHALDIADAFISSPITFALFFRGDQNMLSFSLKFIPGFLLRSSFLAWSFGKKSPHFERERLEDRMLSNELMIQYVYNTSKANHNFSIGLRHISDQNKGVMNGPKSALPKSATDWDAWNTRRLHWTSLNEWWNEVRPCDSNPPTRTNACLSLL